MRYRRRMVGRRTWATAAAFSLLTLLAGGCGGGEATTAERSTTAPVEKAPYYPRAEPPVASGERGASSAPGKADVGDAREARSRSTHGRPHEPSGDVAVRLGPGATAPDEGTCLRRSRADSGSCLREPGRTVARSVRPSQRERRADGLRRAQPHRLRRPLAAGSAAEPAERGPSPGSARATSS